MDNVRLFLLLLTVSVGGLHAQGEWNYDGRFIDGNGRHALVARSTNPDQWKGEDYFRSDLLLLNVKNGREVLVAGSPSFYWGALFTDAKHFIYTEGNHVYKRHVRAGAKPQRLYTLRDTTQMMFLDMVRYGEEVYLVIADYSVKKLENPRWPEDDDSYSSRMRIVELYTGTEIATFSFPYTGSPRYRCHQREDGWMFSVMDTLFVMDAPRHLQHAVSLFPTASPAAFENECYSVRTDAAQPKRIRIISK
ncbi:MAG: hypothetical protein J5792_04825 [Bacteroidales bacterium]|nr:hypothetical protein [Bacteroidales bacterium]